MTANHVLAIARVAALAVTASVACAAPAMAQNWEAQHQLRVGAFWQTGQTTFRGSDGTNTESGSVGANGFGMTAGAELLRARGWTFGLEGDFGQSFATKKSIVNVGIAADYFASLRGRVGYEVYRDVVLYGTGGLGFKGITVTDGGGTFLANQGGNFLLNQGGKGERTLYGGVLGFGGEYARGNTILFVEYQHSQFGSETVSVPISTSNGGMATSYRVSANSDALRVGVKFKLGFDNYTDDVAAGLRR